MGYAKYFEDIEKILNERKYERECAISASPLNMNYLCYYCKEAFESIEERNNHIKRKHNVAGPLLFINDKIASDENYIDEIRSVNIVLCGFGNVPIYFEKKMLQVASRTKTIDLTSEFGNNGNYTVIIGNKKYKIYKFENTGIVNSEMERIIEDWEKQTEKEALSLTPIPNAYRESLNNAELSYLNAFFDYYTACEPAINPHDKKKRYETAFALLSSFNNPPVKAFVLMKIIAFRFNWIERLELLSNCTLNHGIFDVVLDFYFGRKTKIIEEEKNEKQEQKIFVEDDIENCIDAITSFQRADFNSVITFLDEWTDAKINLLEDTNKKDRILFIKSMFEKNINEDIKNPILKKSIINNIKFLK